MEKPLPNPSVRQRFSAFLKDPVSKLPFLNWLQPLLRRLSLNGWRATVLAGAILATITFVINIVLLSSVLPRSKDESSGDLELFHDDCDQVSIIFTWTHLAINVLSSLLLGSSNATMQCLSSPTREEIDQTHAKGDWLDIGISSLRNWKATGRWRKNLYILLALSSLPLHLLYNSVIYTTLEVNEYMAILGDELFMQRDISINTPVPTSDSSYIMPANIAQAYARDIQRKAVRHDMIRIENEECISIYQKNNLNKYSNVIVIANHTSEGYLNHTLEQSTYYSYSTPHRGYSGLTHSTWFCFNESVQTDSSGQLYQFDIYCDPTQFLSRPVEWQIVFDICGYSPDMETDFCNHDTRVVEYCLVQPAQQACSIQMSLEIMSLVVSFNVLKVVCFILALRKKSFVPLVTLGDAVASFLERPDCITQKMGKVSAEELRLRVLDRRLDKKGGLGRAPWKSRAHHERRRVSRLPYASTKFAVLERRLDLRLFEVSRWFSGASWRRWVFVYSLWALLWIGGILLLIFSVQHTSATFEQLWQDGFGNADLNSLIIGSEGIAYINNAILANLPQLIVSLAYIAFNGLLTCLLISREFTAFGSKRTGLRVTLPAGYQRSTFWLSLPYRYSLSLLAISTALHWALSQTLFFAEIVPYAADGTRDDDRVVNALGWSAVGLLITICIATVLIGMGVVLAFKRYPRGVPVAGSNSLAIAAACHALAGQTNDPKGLIKYGVLGTDAEGRKRLGLSSGAVRPVEMDVEYF